VTKTSPMITETFSDDCSTWLTSFTESCNVRHDKLQTPSLTSMFTTEIGCKTSACYLDDNCMSLSGTTLLKLTDNN